MSIISEHDYLAAKQGRAEVPEVAFWRSIHVGVAALAMVCTLPGRTHGLGLFTEPIRATFGLDPESYGLLNMGATLLGAIFCLPCGWLLERFGTRIVLASVTIALGVVVTCMIRIRGDWILNWSVRWPGGELSCVLLVDLFLFVFLTRGLGQSALSVASLYLIGRVSSRRARWTMGFYSALTSLGFLGAFGILGSWVKQYPHEWRPAWACIGITVIFTGLLFFLLVRNRLLETPDTNTSDGNTLESSRTLGQALCSPAFWTFGIAVSFYGMVAAGTSLFNEGILNGLFPSDTKRIFVNVTLLGIPIGLASNLLGGWLAVRWSLSRMLALAMTALAAALCLLPSVSTETQVYLYAAVMAAAGGIITVCFFAVWRVGYGPAHLGKIQGAAQMLTVLFSALGPLLFGSVRTRFDSYLPLFPYLAAVSFALATAAWVAGVPGEHANAKTT